MDNIKSALDFLNVASLSREEWITVGMALKEEGYPCSTWDEWSRNDSRYKPGECEKKWTGFNGTGNPVKGGSIIQLAKDRGWDRWGADGGALDWDDCIEDDGDEPAFSEKKWDAAADLVAYLETLFDPDDVVAYVTSDVWRDEAANKWFPGKGAFDRTAGQLIDSLRKHPSDVGYTVGDWKPEAGAWIRFNPVDGRGVKNENVTKFKYALVESDTLSIAEQNALYRKLELPIAALVHSGGKSLHAIVKVDAANAEEYRKRVDFLYDHLGKEGVVIDRQNRNPSRLSRMPGVTRNGVPQKLVATNIGKKSWRDWTDYIDGAEDELPPIVSLLKYWAEPPILSPVLIEGILRLAHKLLLAGPSKAGKSIALIELAACITAGAEWFGRKCRKGRVLYVNLEIDGASCINRILQIYKAYGITSDLMDNFLLWNLRGYASPLNELVPKIIRRVKEESLAPDAIIIDPIYKVITGDENNASEMGAFCNQFDKICSSTGASSIYSHHHSKGAQGSKKAMDRASGSGVFARDPDAQIDMTELVLPNDLKLNLLDGYATAWRVETCLREFPNLRPFNLWFEYPVHRLDTTGELDRAFPDGDPQANLLRSGKNTTAAERLRSLDFAYEANCLKAGAPTINDLAESMNVSLRCAKDRLNEFRDKYFVSGKCVFRVNEQKTENGEFSDFRN